jgi:uncharacterized membrane protein YgcG
MKVGDIVFAVSQGSIVTAKVCSVIQVQPDHFLELTAGGHQLQVTDEHPIETAAGEFRMASVLAIGNSIHCIVNGQIRSGAIEATRQVPATNAAWNLLVSPGGTYVVNGVVVHNKGCFLPETLVRRGNGSEAPISRILPHDDILAFTPDGQVVTTTVQTVMTHEVDEYRILKTPSITLHVTIDHPFYVGHGCFKTLEALTSGDIIYAFDGQKMSPQTIVEMTTVKERIRVYNLHTDAPNTFFANGVAVHNKGGGGGGGGGRGGGSYHRSGSYRGSGGSDNPWPALIFLGLFAMVFIGGIVSGKKREN